MTTTELSTDATTVARATLQRLEAAWNTADGAAFGASYDPAASFVTIRGDHIVGRDAIAAGHHGIFTTIYAGSVNRMELISATEIGTDSLLVISRSTLTCPAGPLTGTHQAMSTNVLVRNATGWTIVATHNTLITG